MYHLPAIPCDISHHCTTSDTLTYYSSIDAWATGNTQVHQRTAHQLHIDTRMALTHAHRVRGRTRIPQWPQPEDTFDTLSFFKPPAHCLLLPSSFLTIFSPLSLLSPSLLLPLSQSPWLSPALSSSLTADPSSLLIADLSSLPTADPSSLLTADPLSLPTPDLSSPLSKCELELSGRMAGWR